MHARKRTVVMSTPDVSLFEQVRVLENLAKGVERARDDCAHRVDACEVLQGRANTGDGVCKSVSEPDRG